MMIYGRIGWKGSVLSEVFYRFPTKPRKLKRALFSPLEFPPDSFDLVNQRLGMSYLRTWDWPKLLSEYQRITRPGGVIRITEGDFPASRSAALTRLSTLFISACFILVAQSEAIKEWVGSFFPSRKGGFSCSLK
jgi:SAM-dependent methyltransferase